MAEGRPGPAVWLATCGGVGYFPIAPGTAGAAVGLAAVAALGRLPVAPVWMVVVLAGVTAVGMVSGIWAAGRAEKFFGRVDPGPVVIDEIVGQMLTFLARPNASWKWLIVGFVLFRIFDTLKPFPAGRLERVPGGWGIMLDDVMAGIYSLAVLEVLGQALK